MLFPEQSTPVQCLQGGKPCVDLLRHLHMCLLPSTVAYVSKKIHGKANEEAKDINLKKVCDILLKPFYNPRQCQKRSVQIQFSGIILWRESLSSSQTITNTKTALLSLLERTLSQNFGMKAHFRLINCDNWWPIIIKLLRVILYTLKKII